MLLLLGMRYAATMVLAAGGFGSIGTQTDVHYDFLVYCRTGTVAALNYDPS
jgi:predicted small secreted protein